MRDRLKLQQNDRKVSMDKNKIAKFLEFLPIVAFGITWFTTKDIYLTTLVLVIFMTLFIIVSKLIGAELTKFQIGTWIAVTVLGGSTFLFRNDLFIKWKTTIINSVLALIFASSHLIGKKTILEKFIPEKFKAPKQKLRNVNFAAVIYFLISGGINLLVVYKLDTNDWVKFKIFGMFLLNACFVGGSFYYLREYLKDFFESMEKEKS